eukprot:scaffold263864_cov18-Prasinocladus_malaysianus.AAC.1
MAHGTARQHGRRVSVAREDVEFVFALQRVTPVGIHLSRIRIGRRPATCVGLMTCYTCSYESVGQRIQVLIRGSCWIANLFGGFPWEVVVSAAKKCLLPGASGPWT